MPPPRITIITPSFNQGTFIERTIKSVLSQGYPNLEYIVVDGGSTDDTLGILRRYEKELRWVSEPDSGQSDAINKGIRMSSRISPGDIVAYLNSDDTYEPGALKRVAEYFQENPACMWLTGRCRIIDERDNEFRGLVSRYKNFLLARYSYNMLLVTNFICQPATFLKRELFEEVGPFDVNEHLVMDYEYWLRAGGGHGGHRPGIINSNLACFRVYTESKTSSSFKDTFSREFMVSKRYTRSRLLIALHYLSYQAICIAYRLLGAAARRRSA
jgi:glycosyltransferase involved in cell wall biosynthesis